MAAFLDTTTQATDRIAAAFPVPCAAPNAATMLTGKDSIVRHRGGSVPAGETSALVARCVL